MEGPDQRFVIVDLRIPFFRLVMFFIKAAFAATAAAILIGFLFYMLSALAAVVFGTSTVDFMWRRWTF